MNIFEVGAKLGLNSKDFVNGLKTASSNMSSFASKTKDVLGGVAKAGTVAFGAITAAAGTFTGALIKGVGEISTYGDNIDKMSQKMGLSAQAYQEWDAVMQHSGTSMESLKASIKTLSNAVENGNEAFERLGISQEELTTLNTEQLFERTISALQGVENTTERTYLASQLLGRGATELGALLNTSAEDTEKMRKRVHELGGVMSDEAVKAAAKYRDSIQDMKTAFAGMGRGLLTDFIPAMTEVSDGLAAIFAGEDNGAELFMKGFDTAIGNIGKSAAKIKPIARKIGSVAVKALPEILITVGKGLVNALPSIASSVGNLIGSMFDKFKEMDLGVFNWLRDDISDIVGSVRRLFGKIDFEGLKNKLSNVGGAISGIFDRVGDAATWVFDNALSPLIEWVANSNFLDGIAAGFNLIGDAVDFLKTPAIAVWEGFLQPILSTAADVWDVAAGGLKKLANGLNGIDWEGYWIDMFDGHFGEDWKLGWQSIYDAFAQGGEAIDEFFDTTGLGAAWNDFWQGVGETVFNVKTGIMEAIETMESAMERVFGKIKETDADFNTSQNTGYIVKNNQIYTINPWNNPEMYKKYNPQAYERWYNEYGKYGGLAGIDVPKPFANGGRATQPTLAIIGEKEPETVVPDSKKSEFGNTINYNVSINVEGYNIKNDEEFIELLSRKLSELSIKQQRAVGGAGW